MALPKCDGLRSGSVLTVARYPYLTDLKYYLANTSDTQTTRL